MKLIKLEDANKYIEHIMDLRSMLIQAIEVFQEDGDYQSSGALESFLEDSYKAFPDLQEAEIIQLHDRRML